MTMPISRDPGLGHVLDAVEQDRLVGHRHQLLGAGVGDRAQARAGPAGEDEALHGRRCTTRHRRPHRAPGARGRGGSPYPRGPVSPRVRAVVLNYNGGRHVVDCVAALRAHRLAGGGPGGRGGGQRLLRRQRRRDPAAVPGCGDPPHRRQPRVPGQQRGHGRSRRRRLHRAGQQRRLRGPRVARSAGRRTGGRRGVGRRLSPDPLRSPVPRPHAHRADVPARDRRRTGPRGAPVGDRGGRRGPVAGRSAGRRLLGPGARLGRGGALRVDRRARRGAGPGARGFRGVDVGHASLAAGGRGGEDGHRRGGDGSGGGGRRTDARPGSR